MPPFGNPQSNSPQGSPQGNPNQSGNTPGMQSNIPQQPIPGLNIPEAYKKGMEIAKKKLPFKNTQYKTLKSGSLISCQYLFWKHDPSPLILVTDVFQDKIRGVNLHYLTIRYLKDLLSKFCNENTFSYRYIKNDRYIVNAFRSYKKSGLRSIKILDCDVIKDALNLARSYKPQEMQLIREEIQRQLQRQVNPKASDLADQYWKIIVPQKKEGFMQLPVGMKAHGIQKPNLGSIPTQGSIPNQGVGIPGIPNIGRS